MDYETKQINLRKEIEESEVKRKTIMLLVFIVVVITTLLISGKDGIIKTMDYLTLETSVGKIMIEKGKENLKEKETKTLNDREIEKIRNELKKLGVKDGN